jgi:hypothetical protein
MSDVFANENMTGWADWGGDDVTEETAAFRYKLGRVFHRAPSGNEGAVLFIMLNPSTATAEEFDPSVRRCAGFAVDWGYRKLLVGNVFAIRSTDPEILHDEDAPYSNGGGKKNNQALLDMAEKAELVVCAWGNHAQENDRGRRVIRLLAANGYVPHALKINKTGEPSHPLYLSKDLTPQPIREVWDLGESTFAEALSGDALAEALTEDA